MSAQAANPMSGRLALDLVTPSRRIVVGVSTHAIHLTTEVGQIEILPGHADLIGLLGTGVLWFSEGGTERKFAVSYGFFEVHSNKVLVLAETCEESSEIDVARARAAQKKAEGELSGSLEGGRFRKYSLKLERALVRQQAAVVPR